VSNKKPAAVAGFFEVRPQALRKSTLQFFGVEYLSFWCGDF
jgi:hypothetical protein